MSTPLEGERPEARDMGSRSLSDAPVSGAVGYTMLLKRVRESRRENWYRRGFLRVDPMWFPGYFNRYL